LGVHEDVLCPGNSPQDGTRRELLVVEVQFFQAVLDQDLLVCRIINGEIPRIALEAVDFKAQQLGAEGMERTQPDACLPRHRRGWSTRSRISLAALLVKVMARMRYGATPKFQEMGDAAGQDLCLARTGTGRYQQRPFGMLDGFAAGGR
jgi:hypothetical protein